MNPDETASLYERDGDAFVGTGATAGAWNDGAQSGGAVLALIGHVLEDIPTLAPMSLSRLTTDLVRPVPVGQRLWIEHEVIREGKKIQVVDLRVITEQAEHVRVRALRGRDADLSGATGAPISTTDVDPSRSLRPPDELRGMEERAEAPAFLRVGLDFRPTRSKDRSVNGIWLRLRIPVVAGEAIRATSRAALPMDVVNLIGARFDAAGFTAINPDVSGHIVRLPVGEWACLAGHTLFSYATGHGVSAATMSDADGVFGFTSTSQLLDRLPDR